MNTVCLGKNGFVQEERKGKTMLVRNGALVEKKGKMHERKGGFLGTCSKLLMLELLDK